MGGSPPPKEEPDSSSRSGVFFLLGVSSVLLGFVSLVDIVEAGMTWGRVAGLVPATVTLIFIQAKYRVVGLPNVRKDE